MADLNYEVYETEFKGNPMIAMKRSADDQYPVQFGKKKAQWLVANIQQIEEFVEEGEANDWKPGFKKIFKYQEGQYSDWEIAYGSARVMVDCFTQICEWVDKGEIPFEAKK